jgi:hypothetical protein
MPVFPVTVVVRAGPALTSYRAPPNKFPKLQILTSASLSLHPSAMRGAGVWASRHRQSSSQIVAGCGAPSKGPSVACP